MRSPYEFPREPSSSWREDALCRQVGGDLWFPEKGEASKEAKRICGLCPVRVQCLDYAMEANERFGIFGGVSERGRRDLRRSA